MAPAFWVSISFVIYCVDISQKGRENLNTIVSDCHLMLTDLYGYFAQGDDTTVDVIGNPVQTPLNNLDMDYVAGWMMTITFEVDGYCVNAIPMNPIAPSTGTEVTVENSDESYQVQVDCGDTLILPDDTYKIYVNGVLDQTVIQPSIKDTTLNIEP